MLETLDKSVATVLKKLDELRLSDNTLVIFFRRQWPPGAEGL